MTTPFANPTGSVATSGTEYSLPRAANYSSGSPQTTAMLLEVVLDLSGMVAGDQIQVTIYDKVNAGTQLPIYRSCPTGTQSRHWALPPKRVKEGWDVTVKAISGTATIGWALREDTGDRNVATWLGTAPAALTASGYVQSIVQRWITDNAAGTPAALSSSGYMQSMLRRWLTDDVAGTPSALSSNLVQTAVGVIATNAVNAAALAADAVVEIAAAISVPSANAVASAVWSFAHQSGRTAKGVLKRLDQLLTGKHTGLNAATWAMFDVDGATKLVEATQDTTAGTRSAASTIAGD